MQKKSRNVHSLKNISEKDFLLRRPLKNLTTNMGNWVPMLRLFYHSESFGAEILINER